MQDLTDIARTKLGKVAGDETGEPVVTPKIVQFLSRPVRTTARMAAFIPGASPPLVNTAIRFVCLALSVCGNGPEKARDQARAIITMATVP